MSTITVAGYKKQLKFVAETETKIIISYRSLQFKLGIQMVNVPRFVNARAPFSYEYLATSEFMTSVRFNESRERKRDRTLCRGTCQTMARLLNGMFEF